jgi:hypothetical protein
MPRLDLNRVKLIPKRQRLSPSQFTRGVGRTHFPLMQCSYVVQLHRYHRAGFSRLLAVNADGSNPRMGIVHGHSLAFERTSLILRRKTRTKVLSRNIFYATVKIQIWIICCPISLFPSIGSEAECSSEKSTDCLMPYSNQWL